MSEKDKIKSHFQEIAGDYDFWKRKNSYYYSLLKKFYSQNISAGSRVIEFGCATGDILAASRPQRGLGIDFSYELINLAKQKHPELEFSVADAEDFSIQEKFDYVIMSDLIDHLSDIPRAIESAYKVLDSGGKLIINTINPLWNPLFEILEKLKLKMPEGPHSFVPNRFIEFFCRIKGFEIASEKKALVFIPINIPLVSDFLNWLIPKIPILNRLCWVQILIVRKATNPIKKLSYSILIPVYNEEKNIEECVRRIPSLDRDLEILVIDDGSKDNTAGVIEKLQKEITNLKLIRLAQNQGKSVALEQGIQAASKEVIVILDADMAVAPEDILIFIEPLERGIVKFVNGTRLVYDMDKHAMQVIKKIGNFIFAAFFSFVIKSQITDTLCGTKAFFRKDFLDIKLTGERWGDFALLFGARNKGIKVAEVPVKYHARKFGESKMKAFSDGIIFARYALLESLKQVFKRS